MWTVPFIFLVAAVTSYVLVPTETSLVLSEFPVNKTSVSALFTILSVVTFIRDFMEHRQKPPREIEKTSPPSTAQPQTSTPLPPKRCMRGVIIQSYGEDSISVSNEVARPEVTYVDEVLVRVHAASVNPLDIKISTGIGQELCNSMRSMKGMPAGGGREFPIILGRDFSGVVERVGSKVTKFKVGDEVWATLPFYHREGSMGDYIVVTEEFLSKKPRNISHEEAAALPNVGTCVWCSLVLTAVIGSKRTKQQRVLITGGTGGVGTFATQLIKAWGGHVTATCQDAHGVKLLSDLGADYVINISEVDLETSLIDKPKFDVIIDTVGPSVRQACFKLCDKKSFFVSMVSPSLENADKYGVMVGAFLTNFSKMKQSWANRCDFRWGFTLPEGKILDRITKYVEAKKIKPVIDQVYKVEEAKKAFRHVETGPTKGKTVVTFE
ncbi:reticulon-4-interacting protein 1 homolog, mitochondrial-like [Asterias rubens]|uniref:reticulon-4-interacting protein 1 homolog, mitochondrial-like n=1 Tax=Asterias rubens TaxID=7604 RepID=UPI00145542C8|nr:reticulon-4-interacting protein 1 homolog, mitochondrial-like [Asterias rubens]XP_033644839.1 reticulon-4-interacting protein 1 homolog, mitochondrial-like [Asterias rubens]